MSIGSRIKERRENLGLTQVQLAELLGVTKGAIGNYETDANSPKASMLYKVFEILQCDANYLFQDEIRERREHTASPWEMENIVKKYRSLDQHGKEAVVTILDCEIERMNRSQEVVELSPGIKVLKIAGRDGSFREIHLTEELRSAFYAYLNHLQLQDASDIL